MSQAVYKRVLLKLSGEALMGSRGFGISSEVMERLTLELIEVKELGVELAIVIGGGNIFRGLAAQEQGIDRASGDYMGMLATVINSLALQASLENHGVYTRVLSAIQMHQLVEPYIRRRADRHLQKGRLVILAAGTGNPYFTTDTAAALRAMELRADVILKATQVDGVYDQDPKTHPEARKYDVLSFTEVLTRNLRVMDAAAISLCRDHKLPIVVFGMGTVGNIRRVVCGEKLGTRVE